ncbi:hypothetical protein PPERSA_07988 [Pseudocohnilembus persalinus]|uniref:Uncharacterized protein n=1 Tax=Pseudocohnilembus persalinus TaxID=266149 RepID=A0A0V0QBJ1_PSEPJ|nr:hypothetical protein PPERSA_07988 [Pseudocohnilembus persalinus]|eukprot:KRW99503.1 hypothetical protein PPERSA_07988 [Pseudocohnilembus persalinus]
MAKSLNQKYSPTNRYNLQNVYTYEEKESFQIESHENYDQNIDEVIQPKINERNSFYFLKEKKNSILQLQKSISPKKPNAKYSVDSKNISNTNSIPNPFTYQKKLNENIKDINPTNKNQNIQSKLSQKYFNKQNYIEQKHNTNNISVPEDMTLQNFQIEDQDKIQKSKQEVNYSKFNKKNHIDQNNKQNEILQNVRDNQDKNEDPNQIEKYKKKSAEINRNSVIKSIEKEQLDSSYQINEEDQEQFPNKPHKYNLQLQKWKKNIINPIKQVQPKQDYMKNSNNMKNSGQNQISNQNFLSQSKQIQQNNLSQGNEINRSQNQILALRQRQINEQANQNQNQYQNTSNYINNKRGSTNNIIQNSSYYVNQSNSINQQLTNSSQKNSFRIANQIRPQQKSNISSYGYLQICEEHNGSVKLKN